jgi:hypothetical protein
MIDVDELSRVVAMVTPEDFAHEVGWDMNKAPDERFMSLLDRASRCAVRIVKLPTAGSGERGMLALKYLNRLVAARSKFARRASRKVRF